MRTPRHRPRIAIVGAGPAGLAAAIAIARRIDADIVVHERAATLGPVGAGVLIQPIGLAVLDAMGLGVAVRAAGSRIERLHGTNHRGRTVLDLAYAQLAPDAHGVGIARHRLHRILIDAFRSTRARLELGSDVTAIDPSWDLTVLADGAHSRLRVVAGIRASVRAYDWNAVWTTVRADGSGRVLRQYFRGAYQMLGLLPSGDATTGEPSLATFFWSLAPGTHDAWRQSPLDAWKARVRALAPDAQAALDQIDHVDRLVFARYFDVRMPKPYTERVVAIGDCAHATSPQLGQGVNLALLDAYCLANALAHHGVTTAALAAHARRRRAQTRYYQWASRLLTPAFQSRNRLLPALRDAFGDYACRAPYVGRHALHTLAGTKTGILLAASDAGALLRQHDFEP